MSSPFDPPTSPVGVGVRSSSLATSVSSLLSTLRQSQTYDYLRANANTELCKHIQACAKKDGTPNETIQFADEVLKINRKQKRQERVLILTDRALYNFAPGAWKQAKRRIMIKDLRGLILSRASDELIFQVSDSYDYRYEIKRRSEVLEMLSKSYEKVMKEEIAAGSSRDGSTTLMVSFSEEKELKDMVITKDILKDLQQVAAANALRNYHLLNHGTNSQLENENAELSQHRQSTLIDSIGNTIYTGNDICPSPSNMVQSGNSAHPHGTTGPSSPSPSHRSLSSAPPTPSSVTHPHHLNLPSSAVSSSDKSGLPPKMNGGVRQSLITHGQADLLGPHLMAKIAAARSGNFPLLAKQSHALASSSSSSSSIPTPISPTLNPAHHRSLLSGSHPTVSPGQGQGQGHRSMLSGSYPAVASGGTGGGVGYHNHKHSSIILGSGGNLLTASSPSSSSGAYHPVHPHHRGGRSASRTIVGNGGIQATVSNAATSVNGNTPNPSSVNSSSTGPSEKVLTEEEGLHAFRDPNSRLEGWLTKQKGSSKKWDRKYFILTHRSLQYYAPRIKGNVKLKPTIVVTQMDHDTTLTEVNRRKSSSTSTTMTTSLVSSPSSSSTSGGGELPLVILKIESSTHLTGKDALILAFASDEDAQVWREGFENRNLLLPPSDHHAYLHLEGWLLRKESNRWHRRYVILTQNRCWFFEMVLKGSVEFTKGVSAHASNQIQPTEEPMTNNFAGRYALTRFAYRWNVSDAVRIFHLAADSEEDMLMWIGAIDHVNREHGKGGGSTGLDEMPSDLIPTTTSGIHIPSEFIEAVEQPAPEGLVAFVFTDVQSSTSLWEKAPDAMDKALEQHDRILRELLKRYNGYEVKTEGDAFMVTFFSALDAVLWCCHVQISLMEAEWSEEFIAMPSARKEYMTGEDGSMIPTFNGIRIRMGIHVGHPNARRNPVTGRMDYFGQVRPRRTIALTHKFGNILQQVSMSNSSVFHSILLFSSCFCLFVLLSSLLLSQVVNRSARVSDTGHGGQIVCTQEVVDSLLSPLSQSDPRLTPHLLPTVDDLGSHALKGVNELVKIFQLMPAKLKHRTLPPIRTVTNEKLEEAKKKLPIGTPGPGPGPGPAAASVSQSQSAAGGGVGVGVPIHMVSGVSSDDCTVSSTVVPVPIPPSTLTLTPSTPSPIFHEETDL